MNARDVIELDANEVVVAALGSVLQRVEAMRLGLPDRCGRDLTDERGEGWTMRVEGACGELAVAKYTGRLWCGVGRIGGDDVFGLQVRTTVHEDGRLIVHPSDVDAAPFVLVTGSVPRFVIRGWLYGRECKRPQWWTDPGDRGLPAFFVPQDALRPAYDLLDLR